MKSKIRILKVENEYAINEGVLGCLNDLDYEIVKTVYHSKSALEYIVIAEIDIVLIDANLNDDFNGSQLAEIIKCNFRIPYIFLVTTDNQICVKKLKETNSSIIVLQNPTLNQIHFSLTFTENHNVELANTLNQNKQDNPTFDLLNNCLFLKKNNHFERVNFEEIYWFKAESNYTLIHTEKGEYIYSTVLKKIEEKLTSNLFLRVHRSYVVNLLKIDGFEGRMITIDKTNIPVTKCCRDKVFDLLHVI